MKNKYELFVTSENNKVILNEEHPLHDKAQDIIRDIAHFNCSIFPDDNIYLLCEDLYNRLLDASDDEEVNEAVDNALMYTSVINNTFCAIINYVDDVDTGLEFSEYASFDNYKAVVVSSYALNIAQAFFDMIQEHNSDNESSANVD